MDTRLQTKAKAPSVPTLSFTPVRVGLWQRKRTFGGAPGLVSEFAVSRGTRLVSQSPLIQAKLTVGQPNDRYEQEADRVANQVMRMPEPRLQRQVEPEEEEEETLQIKPLAGQITPLVQRQVEPEEEEEFIQTKRAFGQTPRAGPSLEAQINALRGGGQPLDLATRAFVESRFGLDFSQVRVHSDSRAVEAAHALNARAFTYGRHIALGAGEHTLHSTVGRRLLAHELAHVVQQASANREVPSIQCQEKKPKTTYRLGMKAVEHPDGRLEVEVVKPWKKGSGAASTVIGMAKVAGLSTEFLAKELIASGTYKSEKRVKYGFKIGTRIVVRGNTILEISVQGKVYKVDGKTKPDFSYFLEEGAKLFGRAGFGLAGGEAAGRDPEDSYDATTWKEDIKRRGVIRAKVSPWLAMDRLVKSVGKKIPKAGGGKTEWRFDCFEFVPLLRIYAHWRTMTKAEFNKKFAPLELGFHAKTKIGWSELIQAEKPGDPPFKYVGGGPGPVLINPTKAVINKSWGQLLKEAPVGSQIIWSNLDARNKCSADPSLPFCDFVNENTLKLSPNRYAAHPFGVLSEDEIKKRMAKAVVGKATASYINKYIYISGIRHPK